MNKLYYPLENYLFGRFRRVVFNGQTSSPVLGSAPQGSVLGSLTFLVYSDLPNKLKANSKPFADDTSLFIIVKDKDESANVLNNIYC